MANVRLQEEDGGPAVAGKPRHENSNTYFTSSLTRSQTQGRRSGKKDSAKPRQMRGCCIVSNIGAPKKYFQRCGTLLITTEKIMQWSKGAQFGVAPSVYY